MINKINNNNYNVQFNGLKISPSIDKWNKDVLQTALNSQTIRRIISQDKKLGVDTYMSMTYTEPVEKEDMIAFIARKGYAIFSVIGAKAKIKFVHPYRILNMNGRQLNEINHINSIIEDIKAMDKKPVKSIEKALKEIRKIAGDIEFI